MGEQNSELEAALTSANGYSTTLEQLLREIKQGGDLDTDALDKIAQTSKNWSEEMRRYLDACINIKGPIA
jgi:hypothetical protein